MKCPQCLGNDEDCYYCLGDGEVCPDCRFPYDECVCDEDLDYDPDDEWED